MKSKVFLFEEVLCFFPKVSLYTNIHRHFKKLKKKGGTGLQRQRVLIRDLLYQAIRRSVINGELAPGERITEIMLAEQFGMSRTPLREALARLEREQLINRLPNGTLTIAELNREQLGEIFDIQERIEALIVSSLARNKKQSFIQHLNINLKTEEVHLEKENISEMYRLDSEFHRVLWDYSTKTQAKSILEGFVGMFERYNQLAPATDCALERMKAMHIEHQLILNAITEGDSVWAEMAIKNHVRNAKKYLLKAYRQE